MKAIRVLLMALVWLALPTSGWAYYNPESGRWLNRDPIGERGGVNQYQFVRNDPVHYLDDLGDEPMLPPGWTGPGQPYDPSRNPFGVSSACGSRPSWTQQVLGGPDSPELDQTKWFEMRYPGWTAHAKGEYANLIDQQISANCGKKCVVERTRYPVFPYYSGEMCCTRSAMDLGDVSETRFGDAPQSRFSADKVLGSFVYKVDGVVRVEYYDDSSLCCPSGGQMKHYRWQADMVVYDVLGFQSGDRASILIPIAPERGLIRARWSITGTGVCCTTNGK